MPDLIPRIAREPNMWDVCVHVRKARALGVFSDEHWLVRADSEEDAKRFALETAWLDDYEVHHVVSARRIARAHAQAQKGDSNGRP